MQINLIFSIHSDEVNHQHHVTPHHARLATMKSMFLCVCVCITRFPSVIVSYSHDIIIMCVVAVAENAEHDIQTTHANKTPDRPVFLHTCASILMRVYTLVYNYSGSVHINRDDHNLCDSRRTRCYKHANTRAPVI